ncbi:electron transport complex subunit RsxC [Thalassotalea euphylliae]|uniref:electron transport complex subunit RsxC n=1 Tax=Thalassotalea euphylliae TaxID=1655234 RepID=UPI002161FAF0|nr:electron transport complex subunit RsxC [Thalassotalea euphylliae]
MQNIISRIQNNQFWKFHGGVHPPEQKFLTADKPIKPLQLPELLIIPVQQHIGVPGDIQIKVGDHVLKGEPLTAPSSPMAVPIHAPTSGTIEKIALHVIAHPSGLSELCIFLKPDNLDSWRERHVCEDFTTLERTDIIQKIASAGISGMGGAGFPTHIKVDSKPHIDFLIINAAECEPYITADDLLMREQTATIVDGINILKHLLIPRMVLIGIEDNKPQAIAALRNATADLDNVKVCVLPTVYPTGGEKQLIKALTGQEVASGSLPIHQGIVMQNVASCFAIAEAVIHDTPLIKRVVTVSGQGLEKPQNVWAAIGTPVKDLITQCLPANVNGSQQAVIMGGPMMGFTLPTDMVPVVKTSNCVLVPASHELNLNNKEVECIRCGQCAEVCPSRLLPQELQWSAKAKDQSKLKALNLFDCIDCGACAYVCPSHIPLVHYYRIAKAEIRQQELQDLKAEKAKARFEARKARLEREKKAREEKQRKASEARRAAMNADSGEGASAKSAVAAALARVKAKKAQTDDAPQAPTNETQSVSPEKSRAAAAIARAKAKKAAKANQSASTSADTPQTEALTAAPSTETQANSNATAAPKNDRVAAAIARAKAKKAAKAESESLPTQSAESEVQASESSANKVVSDPETKDKANDKGNAKSDRVAAAIAKAKAKKAAKAAETSDSSTQNDATAEHEGDRQQPEDESSANSTDNKKAKIAAAIAKAKAKKQAQAKQADSNNIAEKAGDPRDADTGKQEDAPKLSTDALETVQAQESASPQEHAASEERMPPQDSAAAAKKQRIANAVAKAKAKKQAKQSSPSQDSASLVSEDVNTSAEQDDAGQQANTTDINTDNKLTSTSQTTAEVKINAPDSGNETDSEPVSAAEQKKARIAAAVAKAKAKKQQREESK